METLEYYISKNSELYPDKDAIVTSQDKVSYRELWIRVEDRKCELLSSINHINVIRTSQSISFLVEYFASHLANKVAVPIAQDVPNNEYEEIRLSLTNTDIVDTCADILFTTGTTGKNKGTMISHDAIIANAENLIDSQKFSNNVVFVISGPLNHIGSLSKVWPTIIVGGTLIITEGMKNIDAFFSALDYPSSNIATFLVPASIRMLLQFGRDRLSSYANKIEFIETGAAAISQTDMEDLCTVLPNTRLYNTYASTETGIVCTHDFNSGYCVAGCLGLPMKNSSVNISGEGYITTSGRTMMLGYVGDSELTQSIIKDHRCYTQDCGYLDEEGRLHLNGRNSDIINVGGYKVNPLDVENAALSHPDVQDCICIGDSHPVLGTALRLLVKTNANIVLDKKSIAQHLKSRLESYKIPQMYSQVDHVERTYNGKLDRKHYQQQSMS